MVTKNLISINRTTGNVLAKAIGPVPAGKEWIVKVRVCISGTVDDTVDLKLQRSDGSNAAYRANGHGVAKGGGTQDLETELRMTPGEELWDRSAGGNVDISYTGVVRDIPA